MNEQKTEQAIIDAGKTAPRVTPADLDGVIAAAHYFTAAEAVHADAIGHDKLKLLTFCVLVLDNGFTVTGKSACASPENFDAQIGRDLAYRNARNKLWPLLGYQLKEQLHRRAQYGTSDAVEAPALAGLSFGQAVDAMRQGKRLARDGWNGRGLFVYLVPPASYPVQTGAAKAHFGEGAMVPYNAYFAIKGADETVSTWVPSVGDTLATDWRVVS